MEAGKILVKKHQTLIEIEDKEIITRARSNECFQIDIRVFSFETKCKDIKSIVGR